MSTNLQIKASRIAGLDPCLQSCCTTQEVLANTLVCLVEAIESGRVTNLDQALDDIVSGVNWRNARRLAWLAEGESL